MSWSTGVIIRENVASRLADSLDDRASARRRHRGRRIADKKPKEADAERILFSQKFACPVSGFTIEEIEPRLFSFKQPPWPPAGLRTVLGTDQFVDPDLVVPDEALSLRQGAVAPWSRSTSPYYTQTLEALAKHYKFSP